MYDETKTYGPKNGYAYVAGESGRGSERGRENVADANASDEDDDGGGDVVADAE